MSTATLNTKQACINIINCIVGVGLLAKPYAFSLSGWMGLITMFLASTFCFYTATLVGRVADKYSINILSNIHETMPQTTMSHSNSSVVRMKYTDDIIVEQSKVSNVSDNDKINTSSIYPTLAQLTLGNIGKHWLSFTLSGAVLTTLIVCTIQQWLLLEDIVSYFVASSYDGVWTNFSATEHTNESIIFILIAIMNLSTTLLISWKQLTWLSYVAAISIILVTVSMIFLAILSFIDFGGFVDPLVLKKYNNNAALNSNTSGFAVDVMNNNMLEMNTVSFSLFITGLTAHAILPLIYVDLKQEIRNIGEWNKICLISFGGSAIFYTIIGFIGAWLYGYYTNILILHDFFLWPRGIIPVLESMIIIVNIWSSFGICAIIIFEQIEKSSNIFYSYTNNQRRVFRLFIGVIIVGFTYPVRNHLAFFSVANSIFNITGPALAIPLLMNLTTFYNKMSLIHKILNICLVTFCVFIAFVAVYSDIALF